MVNEPSILNTLLKAYRPLKKKDSPQQLLHCRAIPLNDSDPDPSHLAGTYSLALQVFPTTKQKKDSRKNASSDQSRLNRVVRFLFSRKKSETPKPEAADIAFLENVVVALPLPQIETLNAEALEYRVESSPNSDQPLSTSIPLNWRVSNLNNIASIRLVSMSPKGTKETVYAFEESIPQELKRFCPNNDNNTLTCQNITQTLPSLASIHSL